MRVCATEYYLVCGGCGDSRRYHIYVAVDVDVGAMWESTSESNND